MKLDISNIPRYKASMPLQSVFVTNADGCGDHVFRQIDRRGNVAAYSRHRITDGRNMGYEVITIKVVKAGTVYAKGAAPTLTDTESYPGAGSFGFSAWSFKTEFSALERMDREADKQSMKQTKIPEGTFTLIDFAKVNGLAVNNSTADLMSAMLKERRIEFKGKNGMLQQVFVGV